MAAYSLWTLETSVVAGKQTVERVKLAEHDDPKFLRAIAKDYLEWRFGLVDDIAGDGWRFTHPRSPRYGSPQPDAVLRWDRQPGAPALNYPTVPAEALTQRWAELVTPREPGPSVALYQPRLTCMETLALVGGSRWLARGLVALLLAALVIKGMQAV